MDLDKMILRAIPVDVKCANNEAYNKERRRWLKANFELYLSEQLEKHAVLDGNKYGLGESTNGREQVQQM